MTGFGKFKFGLAPFGGIGPVGSLTTPATTTRAKAARYRKVTAGTYTLTSSGTLLEADEPLLEEAAFRLATIRGTFVGDPTIGSGVLLVRTLTTTSTVEIQRAVELALEPMVSRGAITDVNVDVAPYVRNGTGVAAYRVSFTKTDLVEI